MAHLKLESNLSMLFSNGIFIILLKQIIKIAINVKFLKHKFSTSLLNDR